MLFDILIRKANINASFFFEEIRASKFAIKGRHGQSKKYCQTF